MSKHIVIGRCYTFDPFFGSSKPDVFQRGEMVRVVRAAHNPRETEKTGYWLVESMDGTRTDLIDHGTLHELDRR